jgi:undecaprenyl-diphosphatase
MRRIWFPTAVTAAIACLFFGILLVTATAMVPWGQVPDHLAHSWVVEHRAHIVASTALTVTMLGLSAVTIPAVGVVAFAATRGDLRTRAKRSAGVLAVMAAGVLARSSLAVLIGRERPPRSEWAYAVSGFSFPSGHSTGAALAAGLIGWLITDRLRGRATLRKVTWAVAAGLAIIVGASRVYLGVHWPTDVLGGWAFALTWLSVAETLRRLTQKNRTAPSGASLPPDED